jgi:hypothetical protein
MKIEGKNYCDVSKVSIAPISKNVAKDIIVKKHYTHAWTACRYSLGIFYEMDNTSGLEFSSNKLIGVAIYGFPVGAKAPTSVCEGLTKDNILELTRLYIDDGYGSNIESYALSQTFNWLRENDKNIKVLISYSDNGMGHLGGIYQATNWLYQGNSSDIALMPNWSISLFKDPYKWIHSRTVSSKWGSNNLDHLKREIGKEGYSKFWRRQEYVKHRYIQILSRDKKEKRDLLKRLKHEIKPYPKVAALYDTDIEEHETYAADSDFGERFW